MVEIVDGKIIRDEMTKNARGGTELMAQRLIDVVDPALLQNVQIIFSRPNKLLDGYKKVLYLHDLPEDPAIAEFGNPYFRAQFDLIVFVSHYQHDRFRRFFGCPMTEKMVVIKNAIDPIPLVPKQTDKLRFIYHTTPHRGLQLLYPAFRQFAKDFPGVAELKVFSSFDVYGWGDRDAQFADLFKALEDHPDMTYSKSVSNDTIREELQQAHVFMFPSIWEETSCLALIEAMSANCLCVHPAYGALTETSYGSTSIYPYVDDPTSHAMGAYSIMHGLMSSGVFESLIHNSDELDSKRNVDKLHNLGVFSTYWNSHLRIMQENGS